MRAICKTYPPILKNAPRVLQGNISAETLRFCKSLMREEFPVDILLKGNKNP